MANSDKNIVITPNSGEANDPKIVFSGADGSTSAQDITLTVLPDDSGTVIFSASNEDSLFALSNPSNPGVVYEIAASDGLPLVVADNTRQVTLVPYGGGVGINTSAPEVSLDMSGSNESIALPSGTTAERPTSTISGQIRFNEDRQSIEAYIGGKWVDLATDFEITACAVFG